MKHIRWLFIILIAFTTFVWADADEEGVELQNVGDEFWVVLDDLPDQLSAEMLYRLYALLKVHVQPNEASPLADVIGRKPVVLRFIDDSETSFFPHSTEGFAGLTDVAEWQCHRPMFGTIISCQLFSVNEETLDSDVILLAIVSRDLDLNEMIGVVAHELAHTLGAVDGPRCPTNEGYMPKTHYEIDFSDTYWWYGAVGFFTFKPQGIVWDALTNQCVGCDAPDICYEIEAIFNPP